MYSKVLSSSNAFNNVKILHQKNREINILLWYKCYPFKTNKVKNSFFLRLLFFLS